MSIDDLAREAATDARRTTAAKVVPDEMLLALHHTDRQRRRLATGAAIATVAVLVAIAGITFVGGRTDKAQAPPTTRRTPTTATGHGPCADPAITCLGSHRYRIALRVPVTVTVPHNFQTSFNINSRRELETYRSDLGNTGGGVGVSIVERAVPVRYDSSWTRDPSAGTTAHSMAVWLRGRPFLRNAALTRTTVGGRPAWRVSGQLRPGADLPAAKGGVGNVAPTFKGRSGTEGYNRSLTGDYTLVQLPHAGVTVIWSWAFEHSRARLAGNQAYIDGLSFG
jgi:hypothetical protein